MNKTLKSTTNVSILIIDDDLIYLSLIDLFFSARKEKLLLCNNGKEATDLLLNTDIAIDIIFIDMTLQDITGDDLIKCIRNIPFRKTVPIVVQSGKSSECCINKAKNAGANDYLIKPFSFGAIISSIEKFTHK